MSNFCSGFCNVISNTTNKNANADLSTIEDAIIDFECLQAINERVEMETQAMLDHFERLQKAVNTSDKMLFINENNIEVSVKNLGYFDNVLRCLENQVAYDEEQLAVLNKNCYNIEKFTEMHMTAGSIVFERKREEEIKKMEHLLIGTQMQINHMYESINNINHSQQDVKKKLETQELLKAFLNFHNESKKKIEELLDAVIAEMHAVHHELVNVLNRRDEIARQKQKYS